MAASDANFDLDHSFSSVTTDNPQTKRFQTVSEVEKDRLLSGLESENTKKATKRSVKLLKTWLSATGRQTDFEQLPPSDLDLMLTSFWLEARTSSNERYKAASMMNIRHGINRHLSAIRPEDDPADILKDVVFKSSNKHFLAVIKELKRTGKGDIKHNDIVIENELQKCYKYFGETISKDSTSLQEKVYFDIVLHLIRRGRENIRILTTKHFKISCDSTG